MATAGLVLMKRVPARAEIMGLAPITIRYHLNLLEHEGLVSLTKVRGPVGRPHNAYTITDRGRELLPRQYDRLAERLLTEIKQIATEGQLDQIFRSMAEVMAADRIEALEGKTIEDKVAGLVELLSEEGFLTHWEKDGSDFLVKEYNCPYFRVRQSHPEVCRLDSQIISTILDAAVQLNTCLADGDDCCTYHVTFSDAPALP